jgi:hypothetical protein
LTLAHHVESDPQRARLYLAEQSFTPRQAYLAHITRTQARYVIDDIRSLYDLPRIGLRIVRQPRSRFAAWVTERRKKNGRLRGATLTFNNCGSQKLTLPLIVHEMAHVIVSDAFPEAQDHGREFVGVLMWLYDHFQVIPQDAFAAILRRYEVKFCRFTDSAPTRVRLTNARRGA